MTDTPPESATFLSSAIPTATYSPQSRVLTITFAHGATKAYTGVEPSVWSEMQTAPSVGGFYKERIRGKYAPV